MRVGSVCSGVGTCALASPPGWEHAFFSEIDPFASALLAHRFLDTPNLGDMTKIGAKHGPVDILVGGTPCQSFSVAGLRAGLADPRGNLALVFLRLAQDLRARWIVWENVPGVLSSNGGRDFGAFLGALEELGYGWAYRVVDARHFGVPQRRRRVFLVGHLGDSAGPGAVLFEPEGLRGDSSAGGEARQGTSGCAGEGAAGDGIAKCLNAHPSRRYDYESETFVIKEESIGRKPSAGPQSVGVASDGTSYTVQARTPHAVCVTGRHTHALRAEGCDASEDGTGRGQPLVVYDGANATSKTNRQNPQPGDPCQPLYGDAARFMLCSADGANADPLTASDGPRNYCKAGNNPRPHNVVFNLRGRDGGAQAEADTDGLASIRAASGGSSRSFVSQDGVRRLTPRECERLQGLPDDWTLVSYRGKPAADGPRYKAIGNGWALPVARWVFGRIDKVERARRVLGTWEDLGEGA